MSSFFRYPFQTAPLSLLAICAVLFSVIGPNIAGLVVGTTLACVLTKYAYSIIQASKEGITVAPSFKSAFTSDNLNVFFKQLAVLFMAGVIIGVVSTTDSIVLVLLASMIINLLIPASVIVLALTNQVTSALNPFLLFSIVKAIGWRYLLLCLFLFFLSLGPEISANMLTTVLSSTFSGSLLVFFFGYFSLVMCRLLGYTVYQNQAALGFVSDENDVDCDLTDDELRGLEASQSKSFVEIYIKEGRYSDARTVLLEKLNRKPTDLILEESYHKLLMATADYDRVLKNAEYAIPRFQSTSREDLSLTIYQDCLKIDKDFRPESLLTSIELAKRLYSQLNVDDAFKLLLGAHKKYPGDPHIPEAYLLAAEIFIQSKNDKAKARQLLEYVKKTFPDYPGKEKIQQLEGFIS